MYFSKDYFVTMLPCLSSSPPLKGISQSSFACVTHFGAVYIYIYIYIYIYTGLVFCLDMKKWDHGRAWPHRQSEESKIVSKQNASPVYLFVL
jgi:hypothetical protein